MVASLNNHTRRFERRRNVGRAAEGPVFTGDRGHFADAVHAVLQSQNRGLGADERLQEGQRRRVVVRLDGDDREIDRPDRARVLFGARPGDEITEHRALDLHARLAEGRQVRAARDEGDVVALARQPRAVVAADGARPQDRNPHKIRVLPRFPRRNCSMQPETAPW
jgi:hypothetical protein